MSAWFLKHVNLNLRLTAPLPVRSQASPPQVMTVAETSSSLPQVRTYVCMIGVKEKIVFYCYSWVHTCMSIYSVLLQSTELYMCFVRAKYVCAI